MLDRLSFGYAPEFLGFTFTCAIEAWQYFLPTRVADINDIIWNTVGVFLGAILGHLRERVRFEFA